MSQPLPTGGFRWVDIKPDDVGKLANLTTDNYRLDPADFYMAPGLAWKACLKKTKIRLELLLDPNMLLMFKRGIRGGITQSVHRWAKANNPYMGSEYAPRESTRYLQYLDANNFIWVGNVPTITYRRIPLG